MKYRLRDDVILEKTIGINILVALRTAWDDCPFAIQIAPFAADIWKGLKNGLDSEDVISMLEDNRGYSKAKAQKIFNRFIQSAEEYHYLLKEEQND